MLIFVEIMNLIRSLLKAKLTFECQEDSEPFKSYKDICHNQKHKISKTHFC